MVPLKLYVWDPNKVQRGDGRASPPPPPPSLPFYPVSILSQFYTYVPGFYMLNPYKPGLLSRKAAGTFS